MYSDWQNNRDNSSSNDNQNYNRDNYNDRYDNNRYNDGYNDNYNNDFNDHNNRDVYEYRDRRDGRYERERTDFSPDPEPRPDRQLGNGFNQFNDRVKNLFQRKDRQPQRREDDYQRNEYAPQTQDLGRDFVIYSPKTYRDVKKLIDYLKNKQPIIVDLAPIKKEKGQRILDFLSGAIYALDGDMHKINGTIYLLTPTGVNIMVPNELMEQIKKDNDR